jgi:hypothetical protein
VGAVAWRAVVQFNRHVLSRWEGKKNRAPRLRLPCAAPAALLLYPYQKEDKHAHRSRHSTGVILETSSQGKELQWMALVSEFVKGVSEYTKSSQRITIG